MKALKITSNNNNNKKRYFKCDICQFLSAKNIPQNIILIRCDKCGNNLREISERDYQTLIFNYVNNSHPNNNINLQNNNKINNIKVNHKVNNRNNAHQNKLNIDQKNKIQMAMNKLNNQQINNINSINNNPNNMIRKNHRINIDNNLSDENFINNINNKNSNQINNLSNMNNINIIPNNNINNLIQRNNIQNHNIINNEILLNENNIINKSNDINKININNKNFPINNQNNYINNNHFGYQPNNSNNNINNMNNLNMNNHNIIANLPPPNINYNINNNINPNFQQPTVLNRQNSSNIPNNNINNINQLNNIPQNNQNFNFIRQNTTPIPQPVNITPVIPYQNNNNIESNNNPYKKSKSSNINSFDFWERVDSHKERKINNQPTSNRNIPALPSTSPFNNNSNQQSMTSHNHNANDDPMNEVLDDFFGDFFNETPSSRINPQSPGSIDHSPHIFFQSFFSPFGIGENVFNENYSSNFNRSFFGDIGNLFQFIQRGRKNPHPPATKEALSKLKRFPLQERFCQKKEGKLELPNCCICQCEIELGKETVLLPCGHMYHWDCCSQWLNTNNTCPICRFEIK